jgi:hypothetical protein
MNNPQRALAIRKRWETRRRRKAIFANIKITLPEMSLAQLRADAADNQMRQWEFNHQGQRPWGFSDEWTKNYIRHNFTNYQALLGELDFSHGGNEPISSWNPEIMERWHDQLKADVNKKIAEFLTAKYGMKSASGGAVR